MPTPDVYTAEAPVLAASAPQFLRWGIYAAYAAAALQLLSLFVGTPVKDLTTAQATALFFPIVATYVLLTQLISRGSIVARRAYLAFDATFALLSMWNGTFPIDWSGDTKTLDAALFVLTIVVWVGLLHPLSAKWFARVRQERETAPVNAKRARCRLARATGLVWFILGLASARLALRFGVDLPIALVLNAPFMFAGFVIFAVQSLRLLQLKSTAN